jgi:hypothetical protein
MDDSTQPDHRLGVAQCLLIAHAQQYWIPQADLRYAREFGAVEGECWGDQQIQLPRAGKMYW